MSRKSYILAGLATFALCTGAQAQGLYGGYNPYPKHGDYKPNPYPNPMNGNRPTVQVTPVQVNSATQTATATATQTTGAQTQGANTGAGLIGLRVGGQSASNLNAAANFAAQRNVIGGGGGLGIGGGMGGMRR